MGSDDAGQQAMTSERLAELRELVWRQEKYVAGEMGPPDDLDIDLALRDLLAEVERQRAGQTELAEKLDAETDYSAGRIESLLKRCAGLRHRAHMAEQQRDAAMTVVRAVADGSWWSQPLSAGERRSVAPGKSKRAIVYSATEIFPVVTQARALVVSAGDGDQVTQGEA